MKGGGEVRRLNGGTPHGLTANGAGATRPLHCIISLSYELS